MTKGPGTAAHRAGCHTDVQALSEGSVPCLLLLQHPAPGTRKVLPWPQKVCAGQCHHHQGACFLQSALPKAATPRRAQTATSHSETAGRMHAFQRRAISVTMLPVPLRRFSCINWLYFSNQILPLLPQQVAFHREFCCLARIISALTGAVGNKNSK